MGHTPRPLYKVAPRLEDLDPVHAAILKRKNMDQWNPAELYIRCEVYGICPRNGILHQIGHIPYRDSAGSEEAHAVVKRWLPQFGRAIMEHHDLCKIGHDHKPTHYEVMGKIYSVDEIETIIKMEIPKEIKMTITEHTNRIKKEIEDARKPPEK